MCRSCGHVNAAGSSLCARPSCRRTLKGNSLARTTGLHATNSAPEVQAIEDGGRALFEQSVLDAGGRDELIARELAEHENRALVQVHIRQVAWALKTHGMFDRRGRLRTAWIQRLESLVNTAVSIDKMLGLARRSKRAPTLHDYLDAHAQEPEP